MATTDSGYEATEWLLRRLEKRLDKTYAEATRGVEAKLKAYLEGFAKRDEKKRALVDAGKLSQKEYEKWRYGQICVGKRWQEQLDVLSRDLANVDKIAMSIVNGYTPEVYAINANYGAYQVEHIGGINTGWTLYDRQTVERLVAEEPRLLPKPSVDIPRDKRWNRQHISNAITQGILQGESIDKVAKRLRGVTDMDRNAALRNARTAVTGAQNAGRVASYKRAEDMGIEVKQEWLAAHDGKTRESHAKIDGEQVAVGKTFSNGCRYPGDPDGKPAETYNCRCALIPALGSLRHFKGESQEELEDISFEDWKVSQSGTNLFDSVDAEKMTESQYIDWQKENSTYKKVEADFESEYGVKLEDALIGRGDKFVEKENKWLYEIAEEAYSDFYAIQGGQGRCGYIQDADGSKAINAFLRRGEVGVYKKGEMQKTIDAMNRLIEKSAIDRDMLVDRCAGIDALERMGVEIGQHGKTTRIGHAFCTEGLDVDEIVKHINSEFVGSTLVDNGFMSASVSASNNVFSGSDVTFTILAPKGTNAFISDNVQESEIVFASGTKQELVGARVLKRKARDYDGNEIERKTVEVLLKIVG